MDHRRRTLLASLAIVGIFLAVQLGAVALVEPFERGGLQGVENTDDPSLSILYVGAILVATLFMLAAIRYGGESILRLIIIFAGVYISYFVFAALVPASGSVSGIPVETLVAVVGALGLGATLYLYPEWYVIDAAGVVMGIGAAGLFGITFGILPALVLLTVLAVYDAISVYGTEHMLTLASGVMDMRVPVVFVVPLSLSYSFLDAEKPESVDGGGEDDTDDEGDNGADADGESKAGADADDVNGETGGENPEIPTSPEEIDVETLGTLTPEQVEKIDDELLAEADLGEEELDELDEQTREAVTGGERDAMFIGLGDAVMPTILVASAAFFLDVGPTLSLFGISASLPVLGAMAGTILGLVVLLWLVQKGRAHAGLPLLNGGAIGGYLLGALVSGLSLVEALGLGGFL
ncbi:MAG: presenilin family intramembrane aspartyl protease PSH [Natrialbaceae archaeon]